VSSDPPSTGTAGQDDPFLSLKSGATEIYLIRHADALPGADEVSEGGYDDQALSDLGRRQASALGERLRQIELAAVYSSPIGRARETAAYVARAQGLEARIEPDLREIALGHVGPELGTSLPAAELAEALKARLREIALVAVRTGRWDSIPGSEPSADLRRRMVAALDRIAAAHPGQRVAAVSHGGAINAYLAALLGVERDYFFPAANTSISVVRANGDRRMVFSLNDIGHLMRGGLLGFDPSA
jgi:2,3-bisphosphoglycerate-dependent phosphoglycerate mutase